MSEYSTLQLVTHNWFPIIATAIGGTLMIRASVNQGQKLYLADGVPSSDTLKKKVEIEAITTGLALFFLLILAGFLYYKDMFQQFSSILFALILFCIITLATQATHNSPSKWELVTAVLSVLLFVAGLVKLGINMVKTRSISG